jgi:DNA-binding transcriptional MerR regulator
MEADLSSGDLARATGCTLRTVRFYEEQGLLRPSVVSEGGHRRYTRGELERLQLITDLRELGLSIPEIRSALELRAGCESGGQLAERFQQILLDHIRQAEERLVRLRRVKRELEAALGAVQARLSCAEARCPCEVGDPAASPRVVKVVAQGGLCAPLAPLATAGGGDRGGGSQA